MNAQKPTRADRTERFARGMLAFALIAAVVWAVTSGSGPSPDFSLDSLWS
ncbi:MAG TPA: hypothetical protein VGD21_14735 [Lysobacter sp.]